MSSERIIHNLKINNIRIEVRLSDNFVNATQLCKAGGKEFSHWTILKSSKELIKSLQNTLHDGVLPRIKLVDVKKGNSSKFTQGSWIHPDLLLNLANWISPEISNEIAEWQHSAKDELIKAQQEIDRLENNIVNFQKLLISKKIEFEKLNNCHTEFKSKLYEEKSYKLDGFIYLITSDAYSKNNYYKLGRCTNLKKRLSPYQVGRPDTDLMYYVYTYEIENVISVEAVLRDMLKEFRQNAAKDVYIMPFSMISQLITDYCDNYHNIIIPMMNKAIKNSIDYY